MPLDVMLNGILARTVAVSVDRVRKIVAFLDGEALATPTKRTYPNADLSWKAGYRKNGYMVIHRAAGMSTIQIICDLPGGKDYVLEMAWPSSDIPSDQPGLRDLARRVTAMAVLIALASSDHKTGRSGTIQTTADEHRDAALRINRETETYHGTAITISTRTPWTEATVRLMNKHETVATRGELVEVSMQGGIANPDIETLSMMPHQIHVDIGQ